tara:strand:+ start:6199 stop:7728 length:1530 start_codon:yes stop_codon:yes gene_type:complete
MAFSFKIEFQKRLLYNGAPDPSNISGCEILPKFTTFTNPNANNIKQQNFEQLEAQCRIYRATDWFANNLQDPNNLGNVYADGNIELGDQGIATSTQLQSHNEQAPDPNPTGTFERHFFKMARHSDFNANRSEDPENFKITLTEGFHNKQGVGGDALVIDVYFGTLSLSLQTRFYRDYRIASFYIPCGLAGPGPAQEVVDCALDFCSFELPVGMPQSYANTLFSNTYTYYPDNPHYNINAAPDFVNNPGIAVGSYFASIPMYNTETYTTLANSAVSIDLNQEFEVNAPAGSSQAVLDGVSTPSFPNMPITATPLNDGTWSAFFNGEIMTEMTHLDHMAYNGGANQVLLNYDTARIGPVGANQFVLQFVEQYGNFVLEPIPDQYSINPSTPEFGFEFSIQSMLWASNDTSLEIDCVLDTTLVNSTTAAGSQYGDLLCEVYCCLKKLQDRYEDKKITNPITAALDKNKLNEAMVLVGLFEWAIKCNTKQAKINKYYKNILSVTGCSGCTGCD